MPQAGHLEREQAGVKEGPVAAQTAARAVEEPLAEGRDAQSWRLAGLRERDWRQGRDRPDQAAGIVPGVGQQPGKGGLVQGHGGERQVIGVARKAAWQLAEKPGEGAPFRPVGTGYPGQVGG